ncbi:hypothetical protein SCLCIDRAFT_1183436, partial [Scleroderma citrinum Foug A]
QTCIHQIRTEIKTQKKLDPVPDVPDQHHIIGKSQNFLVDIVPFMQRHLNDPAAADFVHKLKSHLLPCIQVMHGYTPLDHPYCYARVLWIFHANVIYTGPGSMDYLPQHVEFLWVWWFDL